MFFSVAKKHATVPAGMLPSLYCFSHVILTWYLYICGRGDFLSVLLGSNEVSSGVKVFSFVYTQHRFSMIDMENLAKLKLNFLKL